MLALEPGTILALQSGIVLHSLPGQNHFFAFSVITGDEFRLNQTSYWVAEAIGEGIEWRRLKNSFLDAFEVTPQQGEADLRGIVQEFYQEKIIGRR
jgi:hypothetical protein